MLPASIVGSDSAGLSNHRLCQKRSLHIALSVPNQVAFSIPVQVTDFGPDGPDREPDREPHEGSLHIAISVPNQVAFSIIISIAISVTDHEPHESNTGPNQDRQHMDADRRADFRTHGGPDTSSRELEHQDGARSLQG